MTFDKRHPTRTISQAAFSISQVLTGAQFLLATRVEAACVNGGCTLWLGDRQIPLGDVAFYTEDGDSYVLVAEEQDASQQLATLVSDVPQAPVSTAIPDAIPDVSQQHGEPSLHGVIIHRLFYFSRHCQVRWDTTPHLIHDCAMALDLDVTQARAVHYINAQLPDDTDWDDQVILQMYDDIPTGSSERLVLVDVIMHVQPTAGVPTPPTVRRRVLRVPDMVARIHILRYTQTEAFCRLQEDRCIVRRNDDAWWTTDRALRRVKHGDYFQVTLPAPSVDYLDVALDDVLQLDMVAQEAQAAAAPGWNQPAFSLFQTELVLFRASFDQVVHGLREVGQICMLELEDRWRNESSDALDFSNTCSESEHYDPPMTPSPDDRNGLQQQNFVADLMPYWTGWAPRAIVVSSHGEISLTVRTWYIDRVRHEGCFWPRDVRIPTPSSQWVHQLINAWEDIFDYSIAYDLHVVSPTPANVGADVEATLPHVLIVQRPTQDRAAIVVTLTHVQTTQQEQIALSLPTPITRADMNMLLNQPPQAQILFNDAIIPDGVNLIAGEGQSFHIVVDAIQPVEAVVLMQTNVRLQHHDVPEPPHLRNAPFFVQFLFTNWNRIAQCVEGEEGRRANVLTWYVNFATLPVCTQPRAVTLYEDVQNWEQNIEDAWRDMIDTTTPVDLYQVVPNPEDTRSPTCAHIIVCQHANVFKRAVMVSTYTRGHHVYRSVGLVDAEADEHSIQLVAGLSAECEVGYLRDRCTCFLRSVAFTPSTLIPAINGMHFHILVDAPDIQPPEPDPAPDDYHAMLQIFDRATQAVSHKEEPRTISLEQTIPAPASIQIPFHKVEYIQNQLCQLQIGIIWDHHQVVKWHPATQAAFDSTPYWTGEQPYAVSFYTDGSAQCAQEQWTAAAAVILVVHTDQGDRFGGMRTFQVPNTDSHKATAPRAELTAIVAAILWSVELLERTMNMYPWFPIWFAYDSIVAGNAMNGAWNVASHSDLVTIGRSLVHWINARHSDRLRWQHVPAHTGDAWNEGADAASWAALHSWIPTSTLIPVLHILTFDDVDFVPIQWLWYLNLVQCGDPRVPSFEIIALLLTLRRPWQISLIQHCMQCIRDVKLLLISMKRCLSASDA